LTARITKTFAAAVYCTAVVKNIFEVPNITPQSTPIHPISFNFDSVSFPYREIRKQRILQAWKPYLKNNSVGGCRSPAARISRASGVRINTPTRQMSVPSQDLDCVLVIVDM
jgi:hypothetical protein